MKYSFRCCRILYTLHKNQDNETRKAKNPLTFSFCCLNEWKTVLHIHEASTDILISLLVSSGSGKTNNKAIKALFLSKIWNNKHLCHLQCLININPYMTFLGKIGSQNFSILISTWNNMICLKLLVCKFVFIKMVK